MARFIYSAKTHDNQIVTGEVEAAEEQEARVKLRSQKLLILKIAAVSSGSLATTLTGGKSVSFFASKPDEKEMQAFTRQLSTLINAGITVVDGLGILADGMRPGLLKDTIRGLKTQIEGGKGLGVAMSNYPNVFDRFYVNMVKAGEEAGVLDVILNRLAVYIEKSVRLKRQVKGALTYPAVILIVSILVVTGLLIFIVPKFQDIYANSSQEPPMLTMMVVGFSKFLVAQWYLVVGIFILLPVGISMYFNSEKGAEVRDNLLLHSPIFGPLVQKSSVARFSRTLSTLLTSGVSILEALEISAKTCGNIIIERGILRAKDSISQGKTIAGPLSRINEMPGMVVQMIGVGESSGTLDVMLGKVADFYEEEVDVAVGTMSSVIEPLLMVVLGGMIAFIVVAMYLPIFNMANVVGG